MEKYNMKYETALKVAIKKLDIAEAYFKGEAEFNGDKYTINLQGHWVDKLIKLPFKIPPQDKVLVRLSGPSGVFIEEFVQYKGQSEWIEIDSQDILHYVADNQDKFDSLEICISESIE
jgi:hypothetical protein